MIINNSLPREREVKCLTCKKDFWTRYAHANRCEVCREKTVERPKPLTSGQVGSAGRNPLLTMQDFEPELKTMLDELWIKA